MPQPHDLVVASDPSLLAELQALLRFRFVFFVGMPATGKSLLAHQLAHLAQAAGRRVHLLQWDVARPVFEASPAAAAYSQVDHVTHPVVRQAVGLWAREKLVAWHEAHDGAVDLLIGETPLIGNRFVELVRSRDDAAESILASDACRFVLAVPSDEVKRAIEAERRRRAVTPINPRELEDAPPHLLEEMWRELVEAGLDLSLIPTDEAPAALAHYDSATYERIYSHLLRHQRFQALSIDRVLPTREMSVYDFAFECDSLFPSEDEAVRFLRFAEQTSDDMDHWWRV